MGSPAVLGAGRSSGQVRRPLLLGQPVQNRRIWKATTINISSGHPAPSRRSARSSHIGGRPAEGAAASVVWQSQWLPGEMPRPGLATRTGQPAFSDASRTPNTADTGTLTRNQVRFAGTTATSEPTSTQREAFDLIGVPMPLTLK
jgi:hypothetical protein